MPDLEPQQERSRATRRRILMAVNHLLRGRSFESLSVQEIASAAKCSIGAFYGRFRGRDELLEPLLDRHQRGVVRSLRRFVADPAWHEMTLLERLEWIARMDAHILRSRRWLIRALAVYVRKDGVRLNEKQSQLSLQMTEQARALLQDWADRIGHADKRAAIDFALFMIATLCRERVLFGELSERAWIPEGDEALVKEVARAAYLYLTCGAVPEGADSARDSEKA